MTDHDINHGMEGDDGRGGGNAAVAVPALQVRPDAAPHPAARAAQRGDWIAHSAGGELMATLRVRGTRDPRWVWCVWRRNSRLVRDDDYWDWREDPRRWVARKWLINHAQMALCMN